MLRYISAFICLSLAQSAFAQPLILVESEISMTRSVDAKGLPVYSLNTRISPIGSHRLEFAAPRGTTLIGIGETLGPQACWFKARPKDLLEANTLNCNGGLGFNNRVELDDILIKASKGGVGDSFYLGVYVPANQNADVPTPAGYGWALFVEIDRQFVDFNNPIVPIWELAGSALAYETDRVTIGSVSVTVPGDCSNDGELNLADLSCASSLENLEIVLDTLGTIPGDLDGNGDVSFSDFLILSDNFGKQAAIYTEGNVNLSDGVDFADFLILSNNFGSSKTMAASVPEPSTFSSISCMALWLLTIRTHRLGTETPIRSYLLRGSFGDNRVATEMAV